MSNQANSLKKGLTVKDLVTTGIFSAIFFVFTLIGGLPFAPNPVLTFYMPMGAALLCGPIYLLMVAKVQKRWSVTILGIIMGIIWFATGMHWAFSLGYIGMGIIADLVAGAGHYRNQGHQPAVLHADLPGRHLHLCGILYRPGGLGQHHAG